MVYSFSYFPTLIISFSCILALGMASYVVVPTSFIKSSCEVAAYPNVCVQSLSVYANTIKQSKTRLLQTSLNVSLGRAQSSKVFVVKLLKFRGLNNREYKALKNCIEMMLDSTYRLGKAVGELKYLGKVKGRALSWHLSNTQTWVSTVLTDMKTCRDIFSDRDLNGRIKSSVRAQITSVTQLTSNTLTLVANYAHN